MIYREYGTTGIQVSAIGFGGMRFKDQKDVDGCAALVKAAYDSGINYFDTAPGYGDSEALFGLALKEMKKTRHSRPFYISTKTSGERPRSVRQDLETSLKRLGLDYIDFYHVWCIITPDVYQRRKANGVLNEFERLHAEGLIKHICVSTHMTGNEIGEMLQDYPFEGVLLGYSVMNFAYREIGLETAARLKRGVVVMNPLGGGFIPQNAQLFDFVKTQPAETIVEGALRFLLNDPRITLALVGFSSQQELVEANNAVAGLTTIPPAKIDKIKAGLKTAFNEMCTGCRYCDNCPEAIPIPQLMDAYNYLLLGDKQNFIIRLKWHWNLSLRDDDAARCTECGQCESACTQQLPIIERLKVISREVNDYLAKKNKR